MQIFPELQRNSSNKILIRLLLVYFINFFGSYTPFFPIMIGVFILCESFFMALLAIILFTFFHNFNIVYFVALFFVVKFFLLERLKDIIDLYYVDAVALSIIYALLGIYLYNFANIDPILMVIYIIYNYAFDLIVIRLIKCVPK